MVISRMFGTPDFGFTQGEAATNDLRTQHASRVHIATFTLHRAHRLAEAVGAINVKSPEHVPPGQHIIPQGDMNHLLSEVEQRLGFDIASPKVNGPAYGIQYKGSYVSSRHFDGIYSAWRMKQALAGKDGPVLEIGGGSAVCCGSIPIPPTIFLRLYARRVRAFSFPPPRNQTGSTPLSAWN